MRRERSDDAGKRTRHARSYGGIVCHGRAEIANHGRLIAAPTTESHPGTFSGNRSDSAAMQTRDARPYGALAPPIHFSLFTFHYFGPYGGIAGYYIAVGAL